jgi:hypothetical protein
VHASVDEADRSRQGGANLSRDAGHGGLGHVRRVDDHGQVDRSALEAGKGRHDRAGRRGAVELPPCFPGHDHGRAVAEKESSLASADIHRTSDRVKALLQRVLFVGGGRLDVRSEEPELEALQAAQRNRPVALAQSVADRLPPVDPESDLLRGYRPSLPTCLEGDGLRLEAPGTSRESGLGALRVEPLDVHSGHSDAAGDLACRPCEDHAGHEQSDQQDEHRRSGDFRAGSDQA